MKIAEKEKARGLRKEGKSINEIIQETGSSKGSVSLWVRDIILTSEQKTRLSQKGRTIDSIEKRRLSRLSNKQKERQVITDKAMEDFTSISLEELKLIGIILYLGEGAKTYKSMVRLANSDPAVIKIMMRFFREICQVPENKFRAAIHTFAHADIDQTEVYWSQITGIPRQQFFKTYIKPSAASLQKRYTLPFGTVDIYVCDTKLFLTIMGWIEKIKLLVNGND
ncbi:MAG: hypothetical protein WD896_01685 [Parcubacteria group bacterium]